MTTTLNIGILAHVDAGKTSLTERLLYDAGAIDRLGSVDSGDTRTDTGRIERERGITVRTAVAPFRIGDTQVNLIDTPGHADFVAEVERALAVLDGAVLVLSAVEGVQAHTRLLMRVLRELRLPVLLFVNKIDRGGADPARVLDQIRHRLTGRALALDTVRDPGTRAAHTVPFTWDSPDLAARAAELLAEEDDALLAALVDDRPPPLGPDLRDRVRDQVGQGRLYPVLTGSAITGEGVDLLSRALTELIPARPGPGPKHGPAEGDAPGARSGPQREDRTQGKRRHGVESGPETGSPSLEDRPEENEIAAEAAASAAGRQVKEDGARRESASGEPCGTVFAIERSASGEKTGYLRLHSGACARGTASCSSGPIPRTADRTRGGSPTWRWSDTKASAGACSPRAGSGGSAGCPGCGSGTGSGRRRRR